MKEYDVIVAGCGPAGSAAGKTLSENGFSVAMLDKAVFPRPKLCGGLLTWKSMMLLQDVFGETPESLEAAGAINYKSDSYQVFFKNELISTSIADYPFHFADRSVFDHVLLKKSAQAGCDHYLGQAVTHCDCDQGIVQTKTGQKFRARYIIGADGINSVVRRSIPFSLKKWKNGLASTFEVAVPAQDCPIAVDCPTLYLGFNDAGYGWVFPNKDKMVIGLGGLARRNKGLEKLFYDYLSFLGFEDPGAIRLKGFPLPYGCYLDEPVYGKVVLAGDAGGFAECMFGEGLFYAMKTGQYAAQAVARALDGIEPVKKFYKSRLKLNIRPELSYSNYLRWVLYSGIKVFNFRILKWFLQLQNAHLKDLVHGKRSYRWLTMKRWY